jgi:hypothetical protein
MHFDFDIKTGKLPIILALAHIRQMISIEALIEEYVIYNYQLEYYLLRVLNVSCLTNPFKPCRFAQEYELKTSIPTI